MSLRPNLGQRALGGEADFHGKAQIVQPKTVYQAWAPYIHESFTWDPTLNGTATSLTCNSSAPSRIEFELRNTSMADVMYGPLQLCFRVSVGTAGTAGNGSTQFLADNLMNAIEYYELVYNNQVIWSIRGEEAREHNERSLTVNERSQYYADAGAGFGDSDDSRAARLAWLAAGPQYVKLLLPQPFETKEHPLVMFTKPLSLYWRVQFNPATRFANTLGGSAPTIVLDKLKLGWEGIHMDAGFKNALFMQEHNGAGFTYKVTMHQYHEVDVTLTDISSTDESYTLDLKNMTGSAFAFSAWASYKDQVLGGSDVTANADEVAPTAFVPIDALQLFDGQSNITEKKIFENKFSATDTYTTELPRNGSWEMIRMFPLQAPGRRVYTIAFCHPDLVSESRWDTFGSVALNKYNNPRLKIWFHSGVRSASAANYAKWQHCDDPATKLTVRYVAECHQMIHQQGGTIAPTFNPK